MIISSCSGQENLKDYYYPFKQAKEVKIYKYVDKINSENIEYWKVTTNPKTKTILTESFTTNFRLYNIFEEQLDDNGANLIRYADFQVSANGSNIKVDGTVVDENVYKWTEFDKYKYSVNYRDPTYGNAQFLKSRTQNGFENFKLFGTEYETVKFKDEYEIKLLESNENYEFYQFTYYGKNIGMVKYERFYPDGTSVQLELEQVLSEDEFDKLKENK